MLRNCVAKRQSILFLMLALMLITGSCKTVADMPNEKRNICDSSTKELQNPQVEEDDTIECIVLSEGWNEGDGKGVMEIIFLLPNNWSQEAIEKHAGAYGNARYHEDTTVTRLLLRYYDAEYLYKTHDEPIAYVVWEADKGAYVYSFRLRDNRYALTEEEVKLYVKFQETYYAIAGRYAEISYSRDSTRGHSDYIAIYEEVSELLGVNVDTLIDLRIKVTMYCTDDLPYRVYGD